MIALPYGYLKAGWLVGIIATVVIAWVNVYTMRLLILCMRAVRARRQPKDAASINTPTADSRSKSSSRVPSALTPAPLAAALSWYVRMLA